MNSAITWLFYFILFISYPLCFLHNHNPPKRGAHKNILKLIKGLLEKKEREGIIYKISIVYIFKNSDYRNRIKKINRNKIKFS